MSLTENTPVTLAPPTFDTPQPVGVDSPLSEPTNLSPQPYTRSGQPSYDDGTGDDHMPDMSSSENDGDADAIGEDDEDYDDMTNNTFTQPNGKRNSTSSQSSTKSDSRKRSLPEDFMEKDPELYGLRRSGRARAAPHLKEDSDSEDDVVVNGRKRQRVKQSKSKPTSARNSGVSSAVSDDDSDSDVLNTTRRSKAKKRQRKGQHTQSNAATPDIGDVRFSNRNASKVTNYNEEQDEDEDDENIEWEYYEEDTGDAVDIVLNHRLKQDAPEDGVLQHDFEYLIKWQGKAHYHATWNDWDTLSALSGYRRVTNYFNRVVKEYLHFTHDSKVAPEDRERWNLDTETKLEQLEKCQQVDRVIAARNGTNGVEYYIKWQTLDYVDCTWEQADLITKISQVEIDHYLDRSAHLPTNNKKEANPATRTLAGILTEQPKYVKGGVLRTFQRDGLSFLSYKWSKNENVILADEMGLGKTVQTVSFLNWLLHERGQEGPFLVVVPLSTMSAWQETFTTWAPQLNVVVYNGNAKSREIIRDYELFVNRDPRKVKFNVMLATYEMVNKEVSVLAQVKWQHLAVDEAHRLKNDKSQLYTNLQSLNIASRLLITGTPLQNNLEELSALVKFLMPSVDIAKFDLTDENAAEKISKLQADIHPYMLRRTKALVTKDLPPKVEKTLRVELADQQRELYTNLVTKNYSALTKGGSGIKGISTNLTMELRKASNHALMFPIVEEQLFANAEPTREERLKAYVQHSGKVTLLDKLLTKLKKEGHRVLIFSQYVSMLDILEDYIQLRGHQFRRLDGNIPAAARKVAMDAFNAEDSQDFVFLLSTRAGGLGINLMTADTVVIFDSDWNPQADLQAMARAHRIGQKKPVTVYRFVSKDTIEEDMLERARNKRMLEFLAIQTSVTDKQMAHVKTKEPDKVEEISRILKQRSKRMFEQTSTQKQLEELDIDNVLADAAEENLTLTAEMTADGGDEFLRSFQYTDVAVDTEWDQIIPKEQLDKVKAEEEDRVHKEFLESMIKENEPRKRKAADDGNNQRAAKKRARALNSEHAENDGSDNDNGDEDDNDTGNPSRKLNTKETRNLIRAYERYGAFDDMEKEILREARLLNRDLTVVKETLQEILDHAKQKLESEKDSAARVDENQNGKASIKDKNEKAVLFEYNDVKRLNAETLLERPGDLAMIRAEVAKASDPKSFRLRDETKNPSYTCEWNQRQDEMLLVGIARHGYGAWATIRDDPLLELSDKFYLEEHRVGNKSARTTGDDKKSKSTKSPGAVHLVRRVDYLIKVLRNYVSGGTDEAAKKALENHHRNHRKGTAAGRISTPNTGSASPMTRPIKNSERKTEQTNTREKLSSTNGISKTAHSADPLKNVKRRLSDERKGNRRSQSTNTGASSPDVFKTILQPIMTDLLLVRRATKKGMPDDKQRLRTLKQTLVAVGHLTQARKSDSSSPSNAHLWQHVAEQYWPNKKSASEMVTGEKLKKMFETLQKDGKAGIAPAAPSSKDKKTATPSVPPTGTMPITAAALAGLPSFKKKTPEGDRKDRKSTEEPNGAQGAKRRSPEERVRDNRDIRRSPPRRLSDERERSPERREDTRRYRERSPQRQNGSRHHQRSPERKAVGSQAQERSAERMSNVSRYRDRSPQRNMSDARARERSSERSHQGAHARNAQRDKHQDRARDDYRLNGHRDNRDVRRDNDRHREPRIDSYRPGSHGIERPPSRSAPYPPRRDGERPDSRGSNGADHRRQSGSYRDHARQHDRPHNNVDSYRPSQPDGRYGIRRSSSADSDRNYPRDNRRPVNRDAHHARDRD